MQRVVRPLAEEPIGRHGQRHVGALDGDADIVKIELVQKPYVAQGALHQGLGGDAAVLDPELLLQGPAVDTDADGDALFPADVRHRFHLLRPADVAGVDAQGVDAPLRAFQRVLIMKVDVRDQGDGDLLPDFVHSLRGRLVGDGDADDLAARRLQGVDLGHGGRHVVGLRVAHGLDGNRGAAAHGHAAHHETLRHVSSSFSRA